MARAGISKFNVQQARDAILARGDTPTIDAVRIELGNTGSKTTIQRHLRALSDEEGARLDDEALLSDTLRDMVGRLAHQLHAEAEQLIEDERGRHADALDAVEREKSGLSQTLGDARDVIEDLTAQLEATRKDLKTAESALAEANALIREKGQAISDLDARLADKDERIASLEDKHRHARESLAHFRESAKEQRDQDIRQHSELVRQLQNETQQQKQAIVSKQGEISQLSQDAARLAAEQAECQRRLREQTSALGDARRRIEALDAARQQWNVSKARLEERLTATEAAHARSDESAREKAAALLDSRNTIESLRGSLALLQQRIEDMRSHAEREADNEPDSQTR